jgi:flagellar capping protein FliD
MNVTRLNLKKLTPNEFKAKLEKLIKSPERRKELGKYVTEYSKSNSLNIYKLIEIDGGGVHSYGLDEMVGYTEADAWVNYCISSGRRDLTDMLFSGFYRIGLVSKNAKSYLNKQLNSLYEDIEDLKSQIEKLESIIQSL